MQRGKNEVCHDIYSPLCCLPVQLQLAQFVTKCMKFARYEQSLQFRDQKGRLVVTEVMVFLFVNTCKFSIKLNHCVCVCVNLQAY